MRLSLFNRFDTLNDTSSQPITIQFTGPLILHADPNEPLHVATKRYVDSKFATGLNAADITSGIVAGSRLPAFLGDVTSSLGSTVFTLANTGVIAGTYTKFSVDAKGRITAGSQLTQSDIPNLSWSKVNVSRPTTLAGYGITDGIRSTGDSLVGTVTVTGTPSLTLHAATKQYVDLQALSLNGSEPTGTIISRTTESAPQSYLRCNGGEVSKTTYAALYAVIGDTYGENLAPGNGQPWKLQCKINNVQEAALGSWTLAGTYPGGTVAHSGVIATVDRVYSIAGYNGTNNISTIYTAPINADGTLGAWTIAGNLPQALHAVQVVVTKNRVYTIGGRHNDGSAVTNVYTAPINADGTLGAWTSGPSLPTPSCNGSVVITKNRIYHIGGYNGSNATTLVYTALIDENGIIGNWVAGTSLPSQREAAGCYVTNNRVYLCGGGTNLALETVDTTLTAPINSDGSLGAWTTGPNIPSARSNFYLAITKKTAYMIGGWGGAGTVYRATVNADGTLGSWVQGTSLPVGLWSDSTIVTSNKIYILTGWINGDGPSANIYVTNFSGGMNDYSQYYDGTIVVTPTSNFRLPDYTAKETNTEKFYIKYN